MSTLSGRRWSKHGVQAKEQKTTILKLTNQANVAGASSSLLDIYTNVWHMPDCGHIYLMTKYNNEWDMVVSDLCLVSAQPDPRLGSPHLIPIRFVLPNTRSDLSCLIADRTCSARSLTDLIHVTLGIRLDRNLQHITIYRLETWNWRATVTL